MGVKSLWQLLDPVGRPVLLETMEGKAMAIDSSIWIYQFQATMRDKEGRGLVNAHVLGFLRRISKLLFYGIKPVFVFDGGAPALKRVTISERKKKKSGAAMSHAKVAERLLAAHMRREALNQVKTKSGDTSKRKNKVPDGPVVIDENAVYLEDLDDPVPTTPAKKVQANTTSPPSSKKKSRWHDHDPYKLPSVNMDEAVANATRSTAPDPRLATEDELRAFIEEMRPEDFDVTSPTFRELPTEVQYEIIGDMRLQSRQTSYKRLQNMLRNAKTPLDFSKEQIKNLKHRNSLTQQLLTTTDSIGKAHVEIPIRIASERNKEYILVKNEGAEGGWVLGIRDEGTRTKPIEIDPVSDKEIEDDESDADMEEVPISSTSDVDPDLREYRRNQALSALADRYSPKKLAPLTTRTRRKPKNTRLLFAPEEDDLPMDSLADQGDETADPELAAAIQESLEAEEEESLRRAMEASRAEANAAASRMSENGASSSRVTLDGEHPRASRIPPYLDEDDDDLYASPSRLETALAIAGAGPSRRPLSESRKTSGSSHPQSSIFGTPSLLLPEASRTSLAPPVATAPSVVPSDSEDDMEEVSLPPPLPTTPPKTTRVERRLVEERATPSPRPAQEFDGMFVEDSDEDMEEISVLPQISALPDQVNGATYELSPSPVPIPENLPSDDAQEVLPSSSHQNSEPEPRDTEDMASLSPGKESAPAKTLPKADNADVPRASPSSDSEDDGAVPWDRPPSPKDDSSGSKPTAVASTADGWDAADEMDPHAEEGEFARFISQVKGKDIESVRREIDDEIRELHQQRKAAMRDSEDITQQMISQIMIMLRLFGIPYITAPMEAEAQCAELVTLGLVDGIITDDSDVFLFGGLRVLKNMFNQSKTVECFLLSDLERELGLDRDKLIRLAYLLGSDYTDGLPGVGPVVAMELLKEFPGQDGLHKFKDWWQKVQSGQDTAGDTGTAFRKRFKKRFKELFIPDDWPNPVVRDAYYHPTVDQSEEPFKWGLPDLDALRDFFNAELGWSQSKVDDLLLPIIRKMGKRGQSNTNKQGNLAGFFDVPVGGAAPRKRQAYASKRLQQVVSDFRKERARAHSAESSGTSSTGGERKSQSDDEYSEVPAKRRKINKAGKAAGKERAATGAKTGRGGKSTRGGKGKRAVRKRKASEDSESEEDIPLANMRAESASPPPLAVNLRPRPKPKPAYKGAVVAIAAASGDEGSA